MVETLGRRSPTHGWLRHSRARTRDTVVEVVRAALPDIVIARADPADPSRLVDSLRTDPGTENVVVVLYE